MTTYAPFSKRRFLHFHYARIPSVSAKASSLMDSSSNVDQQTNQVGNQVGRVATITPEPQVDQGMKVSDSTTESTVPEVQATSIEAKEKERVKPNYESIVTGTARAFSDALRKTSVDAVHTSQLERLPYVSGCGSAQFRSTIGRRQVALALSVTIQELLADTQETRNNTSIDWFLHYMLVTEHICMLHQVNEQGKGLPFDRKLSSHGITSLSSIQFVANLITQLSRPVNDIDYQSENYFPGDGTTQIESSFRVEVNTEFQLSLSEILETAKEVLTKHTKISLYVDLFDAMITGRQMDITMIKDLAKVTYATAWNMTKQISLWNPIFCTGRFAPSRGPGRSWFVMNESITRSFDIYTSVVIDPDADVNHSGESELSWITNAFMSGESVYRINASLSRKLTTTYEVYGVTLTGEVQELADQYELMASEELLEVSTGEEANFGYSLSILGFLTPYYEA